MLKVLALQWIPRFLWNQKWIAKFLHLQNLVPQECLQHGSEEDEEFPDEKLDEAGIYTYHTQDPSGNLPSGRMSEMKNKADMRGKMKESHNSKNRADMRGNVKEGKVPLKQVFNKPKNITEELVNKITRNVLSRLSGKGKAPVSVKSRTR